MQLVCAACNQQRDIFVNGHLRLQHLLPACSIEYIEDIISELRLLLRSSALPPQERLRVLLTAADILHQGGSVVSEQQGLYFELYAALKHIMLAPLLDSTRTGSIGGTADGGRELSDGDWFSNAAAAARAHADNIGSQVCYLACQALEQLLLDSKLLDGVRQAAFLKRMLAASAAAGDSGLAMGLLCVVQRVLRCVGLPLGIAVKSLKQMLALMISTTCH
jgi:hypothetical protein